MAPQYSNKRPPMLDPQWRYVPSHQTDIAATFARVREQQRRQAEPRPIKDGAR